MSRKYERLKKLDDQMFTGPLLPVKWVFRVFSSITLAVTLLVMVCVYGTLTSVPVGTLARAPEALLQGLTFAVLFLTPLVPLWYLCHALTRSWAVEQKAPIWLVMTLAGGGAGYFLARQGVWGYRPEVLAGADAGTMTNLGALFFTTIVAAAVVVAVMLPMVHLGVRAGKGIAERRSTDESAGQSGDAAAAGWMAGLGIAGFIAAVGVLVPTLYLTLTGIRRFQLFSQVQDDYAALTLYRLPMFEMTELEFYSWWPFQVILGLFVANLIVATIRRIEFSFVNIGVLTVHTGIIVIAVGSMIYGSVKKEGDIVLFKPRFGGEPASHFYDRNKPALRMINRENDLRVFIPLNDLPRYNDYEPDENELDIRLHEIPEFQEVFGDDIEAVIPGFYAYAELVDEWREARGPAPHVDNPALTYRLEFQGNARDFTIIANDPRERVLRIPSLDLGFFIDVDEAWMDTLLTNTDGRHAIAVEVPGHDYEAQYTIQVDRPRQQAQVDGEVYQLGERIAVGDTGYELSVEQVLSPDQYPFPIATDGFEGAEPSAAVVIVYPPDGNPYQRWALDPYPQLTQDFLPDPEGGQPQRVSPNPEIDIRYIDSSRFKIYTVRREGAAPDELELVYRMPGGLVSVQDLEVGEGVAVGGQINVTVEELIQSVEKHHVPRIVPKAERQPGEEGIYQHAALPVDFSSRSDPSFSERVWLGHLRYFEYPTEHIRPETVYVPGGPEIEVAFGRVREQLPFTLELEAFEMIPYPGTGRTDNPIPMDYVSQLQVTYPDGTTQHAETRMNNPLMVRAIRFSDVLSGDHSLYEWLALGKIKVSQAEWDPQNEAFTGLGIGNNAAIRMIATGAVLMALGIPWAFYVKPAILRARKRKIQRELAERHREGANGQAGRDDAPQRTAASAKNGRAAPSSASDRKDRDRTTV